MKRAFFCLGLPLSWLAFAACGGGSDEPNVALDDEQTEGAAMCQVGGCSRQLCLPMGVGDGMSSDCEWRDEYACYRGARCELQRDGMCGWTRTDELERCLASPPPMSEPD